MKSYLKQLVEHQSLLQYLTLGLLVLLSLGQLQRVQLTQHLAFYVHDVVIVLVVMLQWVRRPTFPKHKRFSRKWMPEIVLGLWVLLGLALAGTLGESLLRPMLYSGRLLLYSLAVWILVREKPLAGLLSWATPAQTLRLGLVISGLLTLLLGLLQYVLLPDTRFLKILGWDDHYYRLIGTQLDPNFMGAWLVVVWVLLDGFELIPSRWRALLQAAVVVGISLTFSRSTYVTFLMTVLGLFLFYWLVKGTRKLKYLGMIVWLGVLIILVPKPTGEGVNLGRRSTIEARADRSQQLLTSMQPYQWITGRGAFVPLKAGYNEQILAETPDHAHVADNLLIQAITSVGVVGSMLLGAVGLKHLLRWRLQPTVLALVLSVLCHSLFNATLVQPFIWLYLWLSVGAVASEETKV